MLLVNDVFISKIYGPYGEGDVSRDHITLHRLFSIHFHAWMKSLLCLSPFRLSAGWKHLIVWHVMKAQWMSTLWVPFFKLLPSQRGRPSNINRINLGIHFCKYQDIKLSPLCKNTEKAILMDWERLFFFRLQKLTRDSCLAHLKLMKINGKNQEAL